MQKKDPLTAGIVKLLTVQTNSPQLIEAIVELVQGITWFNSWFLYRGKSTALSDKDMVTIIEMVDNCYEQFDAAVSDFERNRDEGVLIEKLYLVRKMISNTIAFGNNLLETAKTL